MEGDCAHVCKCYLFQKGPSFAVEHYDKVQNYALKLKTCESRSGLYKYILFPLTLRGYITSFHSQFGILQYIHGQRTPGHS